MLDLSKYPRMEAMLKRRKERGDVVPVKHAPMRHIPEPWSFNDAGVRKNQEETILNQRNNQGKNHVNSDSDNRRIGNGKINQPAQSSSGKSIVDSSGEEATPIPF